jgi:hypothetical protein
MSKSYRIKARIGMIKERGGLRTIASTKDAPATVVYAIDKKLDDEVTIGRTKLNRTREHTVGSGTRMADHIHEGTHNTGEITLEVAAQVAKLLFGVLGKCVTTGTSRGTDSIASGEGTDTLTLTTGGLTVDAEIGNFIEFTSGSLIGKKYHVTDNAADTVTLDVVVPSGANGANITIYGPPFTHTISETTPLPTFAFHFELENDTDAQSIRKDLLGTIVNALTISTDSGATDNKIIQSAELIGSRSVDASDLAKPSELDDYNSMTSCNLVTLTLMYNSVNYIDNNITVDIEITNNAEAQHVTGSTEKCWADNIQEGPLDITVTLGMKPSTKVLYDLQETKIADYITDLAFTMKASQAGDSYDTPVTDTVASGGSTDTLTLTGGGLTVDAHIGDWLVVTSGDNVGKHFYITDNAAGTVTLDRVTPTTIDGDSIEIKYPHSIQVTIDKMYVDDDGDASIPSKDEQQFGTDFTLRPTGAATPAVVGVDGLGIVHYEGSS